MTGFWLAALALTLVATAAALVPLWRCQRSADLSREAVNTEIFRERLRELDADRSEGRIDSAQHEQLRAELERTLLSDIPADGASGPTRTGGGLWLASLVALLLPALAVSYYYFQVYRGPTEDWLTTLLRLEQPVTQALLNPLELPEAAQNDLPNFTRVLQARTQREGLSNPDSLYLLGQAFLQLQVPDQALIALRRAHELVPQRADITLAYAQAEMIDNDGRLTAVAERLLNAVLADRPNNRGALMLLGFGAFSSGAYDQAIAAWQRLLEQVDPNTEAARLLRNSIGQAEQRLAASGNVAPTDPADAADARIAVTVDLAPELQARLDPQDTLFIFARAAAGPPMPLAAIRQPARDFPVSVVLDDSRAMLPEMKLSNFEDVVIGARISRAGDVTARPGDLEGLTDSLSLRNGPLSVSLTVDRVVQ